MTEEVECDPYAGITSLNGPSTCPACGFVCPAPELLRDGYASRDRIREAHMAWLNKKYNLEPPCEFYSDDCICGWKWNPNFTMLGTSVYGEYHIPICWNNRCKNK